jgi:Uma2 family endonuclease
VSTTSVDAAWLDWLAEEAGAKVEVDSEGSVIVSPATDAHVIAASELHQQLLAVRTPELLVLVEGPRWSPLGPDRSSYVPDLCVLERRALRRSAGLWSLTPPPLLTVEIVSPDSRRRDLTEKAEAYFTGSASAYWTIELPALAGVNRPELTVRQRGRDAWEIRGPLTGAVHLNHPIDVRLDLDRLAL